MEKKAPRLGGANDIVLGARFGMLTVEESRKPGDVKTLFRCDCGSLKLISYRNVLSGSVYSCGCAMRALSSARMRRHGLSKSPEYSAWCQAKARCYRKSHPRFSEWGGRGIRMCDRWLRSFEAFLSDMGPKPSPVHSLDRINNDGNYEPGNCRWATPKEQSTNRPSWTRVYEFDGRKMTVTDWANELGISRESLRDRLSSGWPIERALTTRGANRAAR
jgi:hypothetical protein